MKELLDFLNARVQFLQGFEEDEDDTELFDGEDIFNRGKEDGRYIEAVFIRDKVKEMIN